MAPGGLKSVLGGAKWSLGPSFLAPWNAQVGPGSLPSGSLDPSWVLGAPQMAPWTPSWVMEAPKRRPPYNNFTVAVLI